MMISISTRDHSNRRYSLLNQTFNMGKTLLSTTSLQLCVFNDFQLKFSEKCIRNDSSLYFTVISMASEWCIRYVLMLMGRIKVSKQ